MVRVGVGPNAGEANKRIEYEHRHLHTYTNTSHRYMHTHSHPHLCPPSHPEDNRITYHITDERFRVDEITSRRSVC
jgi:hypothetical protein